MTIIGIDLGTTNSLVAVLENGVPRCLANEFDEQLIPSVVALAADGTVLVGRAAKDRLVAVPESGMAFFKRDMGTTTTYALGGAQALGARQWTPTECSATILRELKRIADWRLGTTCERAVISVPAYFHDNQRQATVEAARIAGLHVERIINEPTAAALAFGHRHAGEDRRLMVVDLGGGTFDVTVLEVFSGIIEVKASGGDGHLGGEDWTDALVELVSKRLPSPPAAEQSGRLRQLVEVAKRRLTQELRATFAFDGIDIVITRDEFDAVTSALVARLRPVIRRCLRDANVEQSTIDDILMVGGASRMAAVQALVTADMGRPCNRALDPDRVVAFGAAVQAALCAGDAAVEDVVLTDVSPHTLGVEIAKEFSPGEPSSGFFSPIIERNTTLPVSRSQIYHATHPQQDEILLKIFQGEARMTRDNTPLGTLSVSGVRPALYQRELSQIEIRFTYDMNGILEVEATVLHSGRSFHAVLTQRPGMLSPEQIAEAVRRMAPLKNHPRDLLPNRARVERANRLFGELSGDARSVLSHLIDEFEVALTSQDVKAIAIAAGMLDGFLKQFYQDEGEAPVPPPLRPEPRGA